MAGAAVSGSSVATEAIVGKVALPQSKRFGFADGFATGSVEAGGTLAILIRPSTDFVLDAIFLTERSKGRYFIVGLLPEILLALLLVFVIQVTTMLRPSERPVSPATSIVEKIRATLRSLPLIGVILASIGGIYLDVFTPVDAVGVEASLFTILALGLGSAKLDGITDIPLESATMTAML